MSILGQYPSVFEQFVCLSNVMEFPAVPNAFSHCLCRNNRDDEFQPYQGRAGRSCGLDQARINSEIIPLISALFSNP